MRASLCVVLAASAAVASADITLLEETRVFDISAQGDSDLGGDQSSFFDFGSNSNDDPFVPWSTGASVFTNGAQSAIASASGQYLMDIDPDGFYASGSLQVSATILDETGYNASASAHASMEVTFLLATESQWRLTADAGWGSILTLEDEDGSSLFFHELGTIDETYLLSAGEYTIHFISTLSVSIFGVGVDEAATSMTATFVIVPTPGTVMVLGMAMPFLCRRRRDET